MVRMIRKKRLLFVSSSFGRLKSPEMVPAIERYTGLFFRVILKAFREGHGNKLDIMIITDRWGIIRPSEQVPYYRQNWRRVPNERFSELRERNLTVLKKHFKKNHYNEIFICAGRKFSEQISGFENLTSATVIRAQGRMGPMAKQLKEWIKHGS